MPAPTEYGLSDPGYAPLPPRQPTHCPHCRRWQAEARRSERQSVVWCIASTLGWLVVLWMLLR